MFQPYKKFGKHIWRATELRLVDSPNSQSSANKTSLKCEETRITATIIIEKKLITSTVDTGASRNFIKQSFLNQFKGATKRVQENLEVILADGSRKRITDGVQLNITFGNKTKTCTFFIMPNFFEEILLGLDFLRTFDTTITCAGLSLNFEFNNAAEVPRNTVGDINSEKPSTEAVAQLEVRGHRTIQEHSPEEQYIINTFLESELPKFNSLIGLSNIASHKIVMKDDHPVKIRYAQRNPAMQAIIDAEINRLIARGFIEPSKSPYSFPITLAKKKNGSWRVCMDFRQLNARSVPDAYPLPRIDTILNRLRNANYVSSLDLKDGYWQIPMDENSKKYTAFAVTGRGLYQWRVMPFGLHSAPATFQRALDSVIGPDMEPYAFAYLDDIIVIGKTLEEHLTNLKEVFRRLIKANLRINPEKCEFFKRETKYLGHVVSGDGIQTDPEKVAAISEMKAPQNIKEVRRFLGVASWYRRFVENFAEISNPLTQLLKKGKHWKWGEAQQKAFELLKEKLTTAPVLVCPDFNKTFTLQTDASDYGIGVVLTQEFDGSEKVIAYASRHLNKAERNYSTTEKECLAIIWGIRKMKPYLEGYQFRILTDHLSLKWLNSIESPTGRLARWALELQQFNFIVQYRKGKQNTVADALSRQPCEKLNSIKLSPTKCTWLDQRMKAIREQPQKYPEYSIVNGQLYKHFSRQSSNEDYHPWKLCVASPLRNRVMEENHDIPAAGHLGIRKTGNRIANRYYWPGMFRDIRRYVQKCNSCQRHKVSQQRPAGEMLTRIPEEPWATICADFVGPLPRTKHGCTMLLVFFDKFSKWNELIPLRKATSESLVKAFRERIIARYGVPKVIITDNGTQFTSRIFRKCLKDYGVSQQFTAPYTPQENPTERANRTIKTIIAQFADDQHQKWDEFLPEIMLALNTSISETTGYSPAFLTQGREPRLPKALYDEVTVGTGAQNLRPDERSDELKEIFAVVRRNLINASVKQQNYYNLRRRPWKPKIGDLVLARQHPLSKAIESFAAKLAPKFDGPFQVQEFISPVIVKLKNLRNNELKRTHISDLKLYKN